MAYEKDFLMRQLMQLFEVIGKIIRHRREKENEEAEKQIRYFYACLKIDKDISNLTISELLNLLQEKKKLSDEQIELFAFVLKEQGELAQNDDDRLNYFRKSYFLLEKTARESTSFSMDRQMKLVELQAYLDSVPDKKR